MDDSCICVFMEYNNRSVVVEDEWQIEVEVTLYAGLMFEVRLAYKTIIIKMWPLSVLNQRCVDKINPQKLHE